MQELAMKVLTIELVHIGILKCHHQDQLEELIQMGVPSAFYYHGKNNKNRSEITRLIFLYRSGSFCWTRYS